jgi:aminoglycoside-2''-adenylyltransferase
MGDVDKADPRAAAMSGAHAVVEAKDELGPWDPISLADASTVFANAPFWWAIAGGWAIDMFLDVQTREHHDLDIAVQRSEQAKVFETLVLQGWDCHIAAMGEVTPWRGEKLDAGRNNIWVRKPGELVWRFDLMMTEVDDGDWVFRRNPRIRLKMTEAIIAHTPPYVAPHVQLLFKARHRASKDDADFAAVLPRLDTPRRKWLHHALRTTEGEGHPWVAQTA